MKLDSKTKVLILVLLGAGVIVAAYMLVVKPMQQKTATLEAENVELKIKADEYTAVNAQRAVYEQGIVDLTAEREELLANFPAGMTREDEIMYWSNMEKENIDTLAISNLAMSGWEEVYVAGAPEASGEEGATQLHLYKAPVNYTYQATYDGVKNMVKYVFAQNDKKSIEGLNVSYDTTSGNLVGTLDMNMYYMNGTGNDYKPTPIPSVPTGITNPFRSTDSLMLETEEARSSSEEAAVEEAEETKEESSKDSKSSKDKKKK